jgi:hypothetical protein
VTGTLGVTGVVTLASSLTVGSSVTVNGTTVTIQNTAGGVNVGLAINSTSSNSNSNLYINGGASGGNTTGSIYFEQGGAIGAAIFNDGTSQNLRIATGSGTTTALTLDSSQNATFVGFVKSSSASGGVGYVTGAGGTSSQATNKSTTVTLNKICGQITTSSAALASSTTVTFTLSNTAIAATDNIVTALVSGNATAGTYNIWPEAIAANSCKINIRNISAGSLSEALVIAFSVIKGATS